MLMSKQDIANKPHFRHLSSFRRGLGEAVFCLPQSVFPPTPSSQSLWKGVAWRVHFLS